MEIPVRARLTEVVQSSEIARIVLGYLLDVSPESVYLEFARTNPSLSEEYRLLQSGYRPTNSLNLIHIVQEFFEVKLLIGRFQQQNGVHDAASSLTQSLKKILGIQSAKKRPVKRRFSSVHREAFFVLKRSPDVSDCESEVKRGRFSQSPSPSYVLNAENELIIEGNRVQEDKRAFFEAPPRPDTSCSSVQEVKAPPDSSQGSKTESPQVPLKQRLRKKTKKPEMYTEAPAEKKTTKKSKVNIISDEKVIVEQPRVSLPTNSFFLPTPGLPNFVFWHTIPPVSEPMGQIINIPDGGGQVVDVPVVSEAPAVLPPLVEEVTSCPGAMEGGQSTPKNTEKPPFQFKSQSTPRRLASHVRCLFNTPSGKLQHTEMGSPLIKEVSDASKTPHVRKNAKQCARILSNTAEEPVKDAEDEKMREWRELRACSNSNQWDQHLRAMEREKADLAKVKRTPKVRKKITAKGNLDLKAQMLEDALKSAKKPEPEKTDILETLLTQEIAQEVDLAAEQVVEPLLPIGVKSVEKILSMSMLLETPFKDEFPGQFPSTPRFLIPNTTPAIRPAANLPETAIKIPELTTPCFPITPGLKITPERESPQIGPCNRPTDYSSSSSYYKPDESEDTDQKIDSLISASRKRTEDGVFVTKTPMKLDNPTLLERVKSFTEESKDPKDLHYNFMFSTEAPEPPEPAEDTSSSSSSDSSTDTSSTSSDDEYDESKDKNWVSPEVETVAQMINKSGEIRFPLRSWISPRKLLREEEKPAPPPEPPPEPEKPAPPPGPPPEPEKPEPPPEPEIPEPPPEPPMKKLMCELQEKRLRVLEKMKNDQKPPVRKRQAVKRVSTTKPAQAPSKRKTPTPSKCIRTTPVKKTRLSLRKAPFKMSPQKKLPDKSLKGYTIPKKVQNLAKKASYYHEVFGSSSDEEKSPKVQPPTSKIDEEKTKQSLLAMLEDSPVKTKSPVLAKPPKSVQQELQEPREDGEIEDSDDEYYALQPATTHKDLTICHDPQAKAPSFRLEEFNADAMVMKVMLEEKTHQLSLCDAVNIYEVLPTKRPKTVDKKPMKMGTRSTKEVENAEESRKPTIKPKFSLKYKDSGMNSKKLAPALKKPCPPAGGSALPKLAQNQIDVVLQHIHGSERK